MTDNYQIQSEDIAGGSPGYIAPLEVHFNPSGDLVTYLFPDHTGKRQLFSINLSSLDWTWSPQQLVTKLIDASASSNEKLSLEEQLRRERMRLFVDGISTYEWCDSVNNGYESLIYPLTGKIYAVRRNVSDPSDVQFNCVYEGQLGTAIDPHISSNGESVAYVINNDLYVQTINHTDVTNPQRLTFEADKEGFSAGVADFVAQEEMHRFRGFWWSPNSRMIAFTRNDESKIPKFNILHQGKDDPLQNEEHRYPFAGKRNPSVKVGVVNLDKVTPDAKPEDYITYFENICDPADTRFHTLQDDTKAIETEFYVCRVDWWPDGSIMAQIENRNQDLLQLLRIDPITGEKTIILEETTNVWINIHDLCKPLSRTWRFPGSSLSNAENDFYFLWGSERSGFMQLYLYKYDSLAKSGINLSGSNPIGPGGEWVVESIDAVDEEKNLLYFSGNYGDCKESHLLQASFLPNSSPSDFFVLTKYKPGWHSSEVNLKYSMIMDTFNDINNPITFNILQFNSQSGKIRLEKEIYNAKDIDSRIRNKPKMLYSLIPPIIHTIRSTDNQVDLECAIYLPPNISFNDYLQGNNSSLRSFPTIISVYGGPHVQRVANQWLLTSDLRTQKFIQQGMVVIKCDNRGSYRRGLAFEGAMKHDMGNIEVQDQVAAVEYFAKIGLVDRNHVGMFGWSYGGYMSAMSLCRAADIFSCAVAGAPVTSWDGYDTHYTERYMGRPQENVQGYEDSSVMTHVSKMTGKLLLIHGLIDENVHFRHTARLINALIAARKRYELILFPCERHSPLKVQDRIYLEDIMFEFFVKNL